MRLLASVFWSLLCLAGPACAGNEAPAKDDAVVATVGTAAVGIQNLAATVVGFGKVESDPNSLLTINVRHNGLVNRLYVHAGEAVPQGAPLLDLTATPAAKLSYEQAKTALDLARADLARTKRLFGEQLATRDQVDKTEGALKDADAAVRAQTQSGAGSATDAITAPFAGTVITVSATEGEQLQEGAKALTLARSDALVVRLGVEPGEVTRLRSGMSVNLVETFTQARFQGRVAAVNAVVDPQTRLVDVLARLSASGDDPPMIGTIMRGEIVLKSEQTLAVPRDAVLNDHDGAYVFVVRNDKAERIAVKTGLDNDEYVAVTGEVKPGDLVVVQGNYELKDGMAVQHVARDAR